MRATCPSSGMSTWRVCTPARATSISRAATAIHRRRRLHGRRARLRACRPSCGCFYRCGARVERRLDPLRGGNRSVWATCPSSGMSPLGRVFPRTQCGANRRSCQLRRGTDLCGRRARLRACRPTGPRTGAGGVRSSGRRWADPRPRPRRGARRLQNMGVLDDVDAPSLCGYIQTV